MMPNAAKPNMVVDASYLRRLAQRCVQLARECPHRPTSHKLEAISMELMEEATELDGFLSGLPAAR